MKLVAAGLNMSLPYQHRRRAAGICASCPNLSTRFKRCAACRKKRSLYDKRKWQERKAEKETKP